DPTPAASPRPTPTRRACPAARHAARTECWRPRYVRAAAAAEPSRPSPPAAWPYAACPRTGSHQPHTTPRAPAETGHQGCRLVWKPAQDHWAGWTNHPATAQEMWRMLRRAFVLLLGTVSLAGCGG